MHYKTIIALFITNPTLSAWADCPSMEQTMELFSQNIKKAYVSFSTSSVDKGGDIQRDKACHSTFFFYPKMDIDSIDYHSQIASVNEKRLPDGTVKERHAKLFNTYSSERRSGDTIFIIEGRNNTTKILDAEGAMKESFTTNRFGAVINKKRRIKLPYGEAEELSYDLTMRGDTVCEGIIHYNAQGDTLWRNKNSLDGMIQEDVKYSYDSHGQLLQKISRSKEQEQTESFDYNAKQQKTSHFVWSWSFFLEETPVKMLEEQFTYDKKGRLTQYRKEVGGENPSIRLVAYEYDPQGRLLKKTERDQTNQIIARYQLKLNEKGTFTANEERIDANGRIFIVTQFDPWGNVSRQETKRSNDEKETLEIISVDYEYYQP